MHNSKLFKLLKALNEENFQKFYKKLKSTLGTSSLDADILLLLHHIKKFHPRRLDAQALSKEIVHKKVFKQDMKDSKRLRVASSRISLYIEDFIVEQQIPRRNRNRDTYPSIPLWDVLLVNGLHKQDHYEHYKKEKEVLIKAIEQKADRDPDYYYQLYQLHQHFFFHPDTKKYIPNMPSLKQAIHHLDHFYLLTKLKFMCELATRQQMLKEAIPSVFQKEIIALIKFQEYDNPLFSIYLNIYELFKEGNRELFTKTKNIVEQHITKLPIEEKRYIFPLLINFCFRHYQQDVPFYQKAVWEVYQMRLKHHILVLDNRITEATFTNFSVFGCLQGHFKEVWRFIEEHKQYLSPDTQENALNLALAYYYFYRANYQKSLQHLKHVSDAIVNYSLRRRELKLRNYYELYPYFYDDLTKGINAFKVYLHRDSQLKEQKLKLYDNFCKNL